MGKVTGCPAATMLIKTVKIDGERLTIYYDGAQDEILRDVTLKYEIKSRDEDSAKAQAKVNVASGKNHTLSISMKSEVENPLEVVITNGNVILYEGPVAK